MCLFQWLFIDNSLPLPVVASLLAKPFVILTEPGTGKTKLATSLAKYLGNSDGSNLEVVAVGADWTDNRHVLDLLIIWRRMSIVAPFFSLPLSLICF